MKIQLFSALVILQLAALLFCGSAWATDYPLTITDSAGRNVTFSEPVERVIVLNSDAAEAVVMLGAADKVVGVSDTVQKKGYYFPMLAKKQNVGKWNQPDFDCDPLSPGNWFRWKAHRLWRRIEKKEMAS